MVLALIASREKKIINVKGDFIPGQFKVEDEACCMEELQGFENITKMMLPLCYWGLSMV